MPTNWLVNLVGIKDVVDGTGAEDVTLNRRGLLRFSGAGFVVTDDPSKGASNVEFNPELLTLQLTPKPDVVTVATANVVALSSLALTINGVAVNQDGFRVLLTAQSTASQNGIWVAHGGSWTRPVDFDTGDAASGAFVFIERGSTYEGTGWVCTTDSGVDEIDSDALAFRRFSPTVNEQNHLTGLALSGIFNVKAEPYGALGDGATDDTAAIQAAIDAARAAGGGTVYVPPGTYQLIAPFRGTDGIYSGYVANDEQRRANKALIIYDCENIELVLAPGAIFDRSADIVADTSYSQYSTTLYISKSKNIRVRGGVWLGAQDDGDLLDDTKTTTSGDHIQVNSGSETVFLEDLILQDGTSAISIGINRTNSFADSDPALDDCKNVYLNNVEVRNCEHGLLMVKADGVYGNIRARTFTREDASTGVCQRSLFFHSCKNVHLSNVHLSGAFKTSIMVRNYSPVTNCTVKGLTIEGMMTPAAILAARGSAIDLTWEGQGISIQSDDCEDIAFSDFTIKNCTSGINYPGIGMKRVSFRKGRIDAVFTGAKYNSSFDGLSGMTTLDNPIRGLTFDDVEIRTFEDGTNYPSVTPDSGLYVDSSAVDGGAATINAVDVNTVNVRVYARNRNVRLFNCDGVTLACTFTRDMTGGGLAGARNYDMDYSGVRRLANNLYGNHGKPNTVQDAPSAALIKGYVNLDEPAQLALFTVATLPSATLHSGRIAWVSDGFNGAPGLAWSDGTDWWIVGTRVGKVATAVSALTIASGVITVTSNEHALDTESAAASDDLDTVNGTVPGQIYVFRALDSARTVVLKDGTGNLRLAGDFSLDHHNDRITLKSDGTNLTELSRSDNAA